MMNETGKKCTGCNACVAICSFGAIKPNVDKYGFWYPFVDEKKCRHCNKCKYVCPLLTNTNSANITFITYAARSKSEEILKNSSSGGMFYHLASLILENGGIVAGASYDYTNNVVCHVIVKSKMQLRKLQRSKYVQSYIAPEIFCQIEKKLIEKKYVLFSGTPCQVAGIKKYLGLNYPNFLSVDIICHGVPSQYAWKKYIDFMQNKANDKIKGVSFRDKSNGWKKYEMRLDFEHTYCSERFNLDLWGKSFINNMFLRECCYDCKFKNQARVGDISLGDFWGVEEKYNSNDMGCSLVLINNEKGLRTWSEIEDYIVSNCFEYKKALPGNYALYKSSARFAKRKKAFEMLRADIPFDMVISTCLKPSLLSPIKNTIKIIIKSLSKRENNE